MTQISLEAVRTAWKARRHWVAAGFLGATVLFLLLMFMNWRNEQRGIESSKATGLSAVNSGSAQSLWTRNSVLPWSRRERSNQVGVDYVTTSLSGLAGVSDGVISGVANRVVPVALTYARSQKAAEPEGTDRQVIRTAMLEIFVADPLQAAERLRNLAGNFSGFVLSSNVAGSDQGTTSAQASMRVPAKSFDEARAQVRKIAQTVEQETIEAHDVSRESVNQEAALRNAEAEEAQYLGF